MPHSSWKEPARQSRRERGGLANGRWMTQGGTEQDEDRHKKRSMATEYLMGATRIMDDRRRLAADIERMYMITLAWGVTWLDGCGRLRVGDALIKRAADSTCRNAKSCLKIGLCTRTWLWGDRQCCFWRHGEQVRLGLGGASYQGREEHRQHRRPGAPEEVSDLGLRPPLSVSPPSPTACSAARRGGATREVAF